MLCSGIVTAAGRSSGCGGIVVGAIIGGDSVSCGFFLSFAVVDSVDGVVGGCAIDAVGDDSKGDEDVSGFVALVVFLGFVIALGGGGGGGDDDVGSLSGSGSWAGFV